MATVADTHGIGSNSINSIYYDPKTSDYTITFFDYPFINVPIEYMAANKQGLLGSYFANNPNFTSYVPISTSPGAKSPNELYIYNLGPSNTDINLTYVTFGTQLIWAVFTGLNPYPLYDGSEKFFVFGVPTPPSGIPTSGTATYSGVVWGVAFLQGSGSFISGYNDITGTSSISVDFGKSSINTSMTIKGTIEPYNTTLIFVLPSTTITGSGIIGAPGNALLSDYVSQGGNAGTFYGNFNGNASGNFSGRFYGPAAQEYGYNFMATILHVPSAGYNIPIWGVSIGKKN